jgi:ribonuclease E
VEEEEAVAEVSAAAAEVAEVVAEESAPVRVEVKPAPIEVPVDLGGLVMVSTKPVEAATAEPQFVPEVGARRRDVVLQSAEAEEEAPASLVQVETRRD